MFQDDDTLAFADGTEEVEDNTEDNAQEYPAIRSLVDLRYVIQRHRIQFSNRVSAIERAADVARDGEKATIQRYLDKFLELESEIDSDIVKMVRNEPIFKELKKIKGIGPLTAAKLISLVDITRPNTISAFWRYCGYGTVDGKAERPVKGEKIHYNKRLRSTCFLIGDSFIKSKSPYTVLYYQAKERYSVTHPEWTKLHIHMAAKRKMVKIFLSHLWQTWREIENLPTRPPYAIEYLNHTTLIDRKEFGW